MQLVQLIYKTWPQEQTECLTAHDLTPCHRALTFYIGLFNVV